MARPDDVDSLKRLLAEREAEIAAERALRLAAESEAARATASMSSAEALIAHLRLAIEKMRRELYGARSERGHKLIDQMEFELEELEATVGQDEVAAEMAATGNDHPSPRPPHMDELAGRDVGLDGVEEADELLMTVALHAPPDHLASSTLSAANSVVVPWRL
jgi:hypothetical protein